MSKWNKVAAFLVCSAVMLPAFARPGGADVIASTLSAPARIDLDDEHIGHITARTERDAFFVQGWLHAQDRLFQMDVSRRTASGTLGELLGPAALKSDVSLRTLGLRRAAERSLLALSPGTRAALDAYAAGVNTWVRSHPLPPEYAALELTRFAPWTPTDSVAIGKLLAFNLSFTSDIAITLQLQAFVKAGTVAGFDGVKLFYQDIFRSAPFDAVSTVPDASLGQSAALPGGNVTHAQRNPAANLHPVVLRLAAQYMESIRDVPAFAGILDEDRRAASNLWAVSGELTDTRRPLLANDPHLTLVAPMNFYPVGIEVHGGMEVFGESVPGLPAVLLGFNKHISWGATNFPADVTDSFQEQLVPDPTSPSGLSSLHLGKPEHVLPIPQTYRVNNLGNGVPDDLSVMPPSATVPAVTLIVPRRNDGPIVQLDQASGIGLSIQYTGFSATREIDGFLALNRARDLNGFAAGLKLIGVGGQNFVYADRRGNIAYFTSGEIPIREDLQANHVQGNPPWLIRNGQGGNEWMARQNPQPNQALAQEILPFDEMPKIVNPPAGYLVNANNDPAGLTLGNDPLARQRRGGGIYYLNYTFDRGLRAARIKARIDALLKDKRHVTFEDMQSIQADVVMRDAQVFVPHILEALRRAQSADAVLPLKGLLANARLVDALQRLARWKHSAPTGLVGGYDAGRDPSMPPSQESIDESVAATLYAAWRSAMIRATFDSRLSTFTVPDADIYYSQGESVLAALRNLLDNFAQNHGVGASGLDFFSQPPLPVAEDRRDFVILSALAAALDALAGDAYATAFDHSANLDDYRWGKLHRLTLTHVLGSPFSIPPAAGAFPQPLPGVPGIAVDGGYATVDVASHPVRATTAQDYHFDIGPVRRFVSQPGGDHGRNESIWPGGMSGVPGRPGYLQFLGRWLQNESIPVSLDDFASAGQIRFKPR